MKLLRFGIQSISDIGKHYDSCTPDYPEKAKGEAPQATTHIDLTEGEWVDVCNDCGAVMARFFHED